MKLHYMGTYDRNPESIPAKPHKPNCVKFKEPEDSKKPDNPSTQNPVDEKEETVDEGAVQISPHTMSPKTGDSSKVVLWMLLAIATIVSSALIIKRRKNNS